MQYSSGHRKVIGGVARQDCSCASQARLYRTSQTNRKHASCNYYQTLLTGRPGLCTPVQTLVRIKFKLAPDSRLIYTALVLNKLISTKSVTSNNLFYITDTDNQHIRRVFESLQNARPQKSMFTFFGQWRGSWAVLSSNCEATYGDNQP